MKYQKNTSHFSVLDIINVSNFSVKKQVCLILCVLWRAYPAYGSKTIGSWWSCKSLKTFHKHTVSYSQLYSSTNQSGCRTYGHRVMMLTNGQNSALAEHYDVTVKLKFDLWPPKLIQVILESQWTFVPDDMTKHDVSCCCRDIKSSVTETLTVVWLRQIRVHFLQTNYIRCCGE